MFFRESGENKIRLRDGEESTVCLRAFPTPKASGTHGDLGLLNLVPGALRIEFGIDKTGETLLLIRLQYVDPWNEENRTNGYGAQQADGKSLLPLQTA